MNEKIKPILATILLLFAGITLAVQVAKEFRSVEPLTLGNGLNVVCTHATARCPTCTTMERLTKETLDEFYKDSENVVFREVNYESPEAANFADEYQVATASVVLVNIQNGKTVAGINLANEAWKLHTDGPAFKQMLKAQIDAVLQGKTLKTEDTTEEIIFGGGDDTTFSL